MAQAYNPAMESYKAYLANRTPMYRAATGEKFPPFFPETVEEALREWRDFQNLALWEKVKPGQPFPQMDRPLSPIAVECLKGRKLLPIDPMQLDG